MHILGSHIRAMQKGDPAFEFTSGARVWGQIAALLRVPFRYVRLLQMKSSPALFFNQSVSRIRDTLGQGNGSFSTK